MKNIVRSQRRYQTRTSFLPADGYFHCFSDGMCSIGKNFCVAVPSLIISALSRGSNLNIYQSTQHTALYSSHLPNTSHRRRGVP